MVTDNYLIISSDTHAGLPDAQYKEYLEPRYREAFDEDLVQRAALRAQMNAQVKELEFVKDWYDENEEGLRGGWDAARRDAELEADGVVGEVIFPDADAVLGGASASGKMTSPTTPSASSSASRRAASHPPRSPSSFSSYQSLTNSSSFTWAFIWARSAARCTRSSSKASRYRGSRYSLY